MGGDISFEDGPEQEPVSSNENIFGDARLPRPEDCIPYEDWHSKPDKPQTCDVEGYNPHAGFVRRLRSSEIFETVGDTLGDTATPAYEAPPAEQLYDSLVPRWQQRMILSNSEVNAPVPAMVERAMELIHTDSKLERLVGRNLDGFIGTDTVKRDASGVYPCSIEITGPVSDRSYKCVLHLPIVEKSEPAQIASAICLFAKYAEFGRQGRSDWGSPDIRIAALEVQQDVLSRFGGDSKWVKHQLEQLGPKLARYKEELALVS